MCGIFGSFDKKNFFELYKKNLDRGDYSFGICCVNEIETFILKKKGRMKLSDVSEDMNFFLGHTRAPTVATSEFKPGTSHPFQVGNWIVGHNGIIQNYKQLQEEYGFEHEVDSYAIPYLLNRLDGPSIEEIIIQVVLEKLDGIFGCWILNQETSHLYLVRCASTIYFKKGCFSSAEFEGAELLKEGIIYLLEGNSLRKVRKFKYNSPYYVSEE